MSDPQGHKPIDEKTFTPNFLVGCTILELAALQHDLRMFSTDAPYLKQVLNEIARRVKNPND